MNGRALKVVGLGVASVGMGCIYALLLLGRHARFPMQGALVGGEWWFAIFAVGSSLLGALAAAWLRNAGSIFVGGSAAALAILTLIAVKAHLWPEVPAVADRFAAIPAIFALGGATAAALTLRAQGSFDQIVVALLGSIAGPLLLTYLIAMVVGS